MKADEGENCEWAAFRFYLFTISWIDNLAFTGVLFSQKLYLLGLFFGKWSCL